MAPNQICSKETTRDISQQDNIETFHNNITYATKQYYLKAVPFLEGHSVLPYIYIQSFFISIALLRVSLSMLMIFLIVALYFAYYMYKIIESVSQLRPNYNIIRAKSHSSLQQQRNNNSLVTLFKKECFSYQLQEKKSF